MGYSRKEEIAKLRQQRREAKASKKRKENVREKLVRFLIVCEGTKTEPHYFEALIKTYISTVREVTIEGEGRATVALVDKTLEIKQELERKNAMSFDRVWVVFDKDDFDDFNDAIKKAHKLGFQAPGRMKPLNSGTICILIILTQALVARPTLTNCKMPFARRWAMMALSIGKEILIYTAFSSSMAARTWPSALPNSYAHYTQAPTMLPISHARWLTSWWKNWNIQRCC